MENLTELDPSGNAPWFHRVEIINGCLVLHWRMADGNDRIRCLTSQETQTLLKFLNDHKIEIFKD